MLAIVWKTVSYLSNMILDNRIERSFNNMIEKNKYKDIMKFLETFNPQFADSDIDLFSFQQYLNSSEFKQFLFKSMYERNSSALLNDDEIIKTLVTNASFVINRANNEHNRPLFTRNELLTEYFTDFLKLLREKRNADISFDDNVQTSVILEGISKVMKGELSSKKKIVSSELVTEMMDLSIASLGPRYSSKINVETKNSLTFEALFKSKICLTYLSEIIDMVCEKITFLEEHIALNSKMLESTWYEELRNSNYYKYIIKTNERELGYDLNFKVLYKKTKDFVKLIPNSFFIDNLTLDEKKHLNYYLDNADHAIHNLIQFLEEVPIAVIDNPYLVVTGPAGIGKSHLLADYAEKMIRQGHNNFLFLGQSFFNSSSPSDQICNSMNIETTRIDELLKYLDEDAKISGFRACILIDALNEGIGKEYWKDQLDSFIHKIQKYKNIGIVLSVRSEYYHSVFPTDFAKNHNFSIMTHSGFEDNVEFALKSFAHHYGLELPTMPYLSEEYKNPLLLKMLCEGLKKKNTKEFLTTLSADELFENFIDMANEKISSPQRLNFDVHRMVVQEALTILSNLKFHEKWNIVNYKFYSDTLASKFVTLGFPNAGNLVREMVSEGLIKIDFNYGGEEIIDFSYEKLSDYSVAKYVFEEYIKNKEIDNLQNISILAPLFKDDLNMQNNYGILVMLAARIAKENTKEFWELLPNFKNNILVYTISIESLSYRKPNQISDSFVYFVENIITHSPQLLKYFWHEQFKICLISGATFNSKWLYQFLTKKNNSDFDFIWTANISKMYQTYIRDFIVWFQTDRILEYKTAELALYQLLLLLSSPNRYYRDNTTKTISIILKNEPRLLSLCPTFMLEIKDPYIMERLLAAILGGIVNMDWSLNKTAIQELGKLVYTIIFDNNKEAYPHVLVRDYAKQIIDYVIFKSDNEPEYTRFFENNKHNSPYSSEWIYKETSKEWLKNQENIHIADSGFSSIVSSMKPNWGDFARYIFESNIEKWNQYFSSKELIYMGIRRLLEIGYDPKKFSEFDKLDGKYFDRYGNIEERMGKKYQWIVFHEMMARISDNFIPYEIQYEYDDQYNEYLKNPRYSYLDLLTEYIWDDDELDSAKAEVPSHKIAFPKKEIMSSEDHIINQKKRYTPYTGPWDDYLRDIDPTVLVEHLPEKIQNNFFKGLPEIVDSTWIKQNLSVKELTDPLEFSFRNKKYVNLAFYFDEKRINKKSNTSLLGKDDNFTLMGRALIAPNSIRTDVVNNKKQSKGNNVFPPSTTTIYLREYYWSIAYQSWKTSRYEDDEKFAPEIEYAAHHYGWEKANQYTMMNSNEPNANFSMFLPSDFFTNYFNLEMNLNYEWVNKDLEIIAFDGRIYGYEDGLYFRKDHLDKYLLENNAFILWECYFDKVGLNMFHDSHYLVYIEDNKYVVYIQDQRSDFYNQ